MSKFSNFLEELFIYNPPRDYDFKLVESSQEDTTHLNNPPSLSLPDDTDISGVLDNNINYLKSKYNVLINSDVIFRPFIISVNGKSYHAFLVGFDGMISSNLVNNFILRPLIKTNNFKHSSNKILTKNGVTIKKFKKFNLENYIFDKLLPQVSIKKTHSFSDVISSINMGDAALFVDSLNVSFTLDVKGFESRSIDTPKNEIVVRGSQEAFVEKLRTNTSILRRNINSADLIIEKTNIGKISNTNIAICYMKGIVNPELVAEVKYRLNNVSIDYVLSSRTS